MREFRAGVTSLGRKAPDGRPLEAVTLGFELKALSEDGTGEGYLSVMGNEDSYGDVVEKGAFKKTLAERSEDNPVPFLWQHRSEEPIGVYTELREMRKQFADEPANAVLYAKFRYTRGVQRADEAYLLAKDRACKGMSIGYTTITSKDDPATGLRYLKEVRLWEGSQVTFPANELATITGVKSADELEAEIERLSAQLDELKSARRGVSSDAAAIRALIADVKDALGTARRGEPGQPTRIAEEIKSYLTSR